MISFTSPCNSEGSDGDAEKKKTIKLIGNIFISQLS